MTTEFPRIVCAILCISFDSDGKEQVQDYTYHHA